MGQQQDCCCAAKGDTEISVVPQRSDAPGRAGFGDMGVLQLQSPDPPVEEASPSGRAPAMRKSAADGELTGQHKLEWDDGSSFNGQLRAGKKHGHGEWTSAGGRTTYNGEWANDTMHGKGTQSWSDGRSYEGEFENGRFSGEGKMVWQTQQGQLIYQGQYQDDMKHGHGKFTWADGRTYDGEWKLGKRDGKGAYATLNGELKVGYWSANKWLRWEAEH